MALGGARPGAGRPRLYADKLAQALVRKANENAEELSTVLMAKALEGDLPAIKEMLDRGVGRALQAVDHTSGGEPLAVNVVSFTPSSDDDNNDSAPVHAA